MTLTGYYHRFKRLLCLVLCLLIICFQVVTSYQEAYAFAPALILAGYAVPEAVAVVGALLVGTGLFFGTEYALDSASDWFYENCAPDIKQGIADMIGTASNGIANVTDGVWNYTRDWVRAKFGTQAGDVTVTNYVVEHTMTDGQVWPVTIAKNLPDSNCWPCAPLGQTFTYKGDVYSLRFTVNVPYSDGTVEYRYIIKKNGADFLANGVNIGGYCYEKNVTFFLAATASGVRVCTKYFNKSFGERTAIHTELTLDPYSTVSQYWGSTPASTAITATRTDVMTNPTWDIKDTSGRRAIGFPIDGDLSKLANKTHADVANPTDVVNPPAATGELNWEPLKVAGALFTTAFPFSLPWDLLRSFQTVSQANANPPPFNFDFTTKLMGHVHFSVSLAMFDDLIRVARTIELLTFDVGLILLTRKLLGGAV